MYKINEVRVVCEKIYGREIKESTWRKWRQFTGVGAIETDNGGYVQRKTYTDKQAYYLAAYAFLKRKYPHKQFKLGDILREIKKEKTLPEIVDIHLSSNIKGSELPTIIEQLNGRKLSLRTVYRIASRLNIEFSINKIYTKDEVENFLAYLEND